jgi:hypothetical protein
VRPPREYRRVAENSPSFKHDQSPQREKGIGKKCQEQRSQEENEYHLVCITHLPGLELYSEGMSIMKNSESWVCKDHVSISKYVAALCVCVYVCVCVCVTFKSQVWPGEGWLIRQMVWINVPVVRLVRSTEIHDTFGILEMRDEVKIMIGHFDSWVDDVTVHCLG